MFCEFRKFTFFTYNQYKIRVNNNRVFLSPALYTALLVLTALQGGFLYPHFIDEQIEAWQGSVTIPLAHSRAGALCLQSSQLFP